MATEAPLAMRRREEREARRTALLKAGIKELRAKGFDRMTLASVAHRARLSKSLIYFYFRDKEDLVVAIANTAKERLLACFREAVATEERGCEQLKAIGRAYIEFPKNHPEFWEVLAETELFDVQRDKMTPNTEAALELGAALIQEVAAPIHRGQADGSLMPTEESPEQIGILLWSYLYGFNRLVKAKGDLIEKASGIRIGEMVDSALTHCCGALMPREGDPGYRQPEG
ncbi:MAG: TetR/AcrR family transcriptional regulator [Opitutales bacterium]